MDPEEGTVRAPQDDKNDGLKLVLSKLVAIEVVAKSLQLVAEFRSCSMPREIVTLQCGDCKERNYSTTKNRKTTTERLEFKKFCRRCRKHTAHKEVK